MKTHLIATLISATVALSPFTFAATPDFPHLETVGIGEVVTTPDTASINVAVTLNRTTAEAAKESSDNAVAALLERLEKMGVARKDIESANIYLQPKYSYPTNGEPKLTGYSATRNVTITVRDLEKVNTLLDGAISDGINRINSISFSSSQNAVLKEKARMAAIEDAKAKAKSLATGFGEKLAGVWEIRYMDQNPIRPVMMRMAESANDISATYNDAKITIRDRVEVIFALAE